MCVWYARMGRMLVAHLIIVYVLEVARKTIPTTTTTAFNSIILFGFHFQQLRSVPINKEFQEHVFIERNRRHHHHRWIHLYHFERHRIITSSSPSAAAADGYYVIAIDLISRSIRLPRKSKSKTSWAMSPSPYHIVSIVSISAKIWNDKLNQCRAGAHSFIIATKTPKSIAGTDVMTQNEREESIGSRAWKRDHRQIQLHVWSVWHDQQHYIGSPPVVGSLFRPEHTQYFYWPFQHKFFRYFYASGDTHDRSLSLRVFCSSTKHMFHDKISWWPRNTERSIRRSSVVEWCDWQVFESPNGQMLFGRKANWII